MINSVIAGCYRYADFRDIAFYGNANFDNTSFLYMVNFLNVSFSSDTDFPRVKFSGETSFSKCRFKGILNFEDCIYPEYRKIVLKDIIFSSQMLIEWEYDDKYVKPNGFDKKRHGLKGNFEYDESFYLNLVKNYENMGWVKQSNDAYYNYRKEKRTRLSSYSISRYTQFIFLQITCGYGTKSGRLILSFVFIWLFFSCYYFCCYYFSPSHHRCDCLDKKRKISQLKNFISYFLRLKHHVWAFSYSLNTLTPGFDLALIVPLEERIKYAQKSKAFIYGQSMHMLLNWYLLVLVGILLTKTRV